MDYNYPGTPLSPVDFKRELNKTIKDLQKALESEKKLNRYSNLFYRLDLHDNGLQEKIDLYSAIRDERLFPVQRVNDQHNVRMFIIAIVQKFLNDGLLSKDGDSEYKFKHILKFNMSLLGLDCFPDSPMEEVNVRKAINDEINRKQNDHNIYGSHQDPMRNYSGGLGKGLAALILQK